MRFIPHHRADDAFVMLTDDCLEWQPHAPGMQALPVQLPLLVTARRAKPAASHQEACIMHVLKAVATGTVEPSATRVHPAASIPPRLQQFALPSCCAQPLTASVLRCTCLAAEAEAEQQGALAHSSSPSCCARPACALAPATCPRAAPPAQGTGAYTAAPAAGPGLQGTGQPHRTHPTPPHTRHQHSCTR